MALTSGSEYQKCCERRNDDHDEDDSARPFQRGLFAIFVVWTLVATWYVIIFGLFGIFVIPFRLLRSGSRKNKIAAAHHAEMMTQLRRR
jgi:hypothetical protein